MKEKREKTQINIIRNEKGEVRDKEEKREERKD